MLGELVAAVAAVAALSGGIEAELPEHLSPDPLAATVAQERADRAAEADVFAHDHGYRLHELLSTATYTGELIARCSSCTPSGVVTAWHESSSHDRALRSRDFDRYGIGVAVNEDGTGKTYVTLVLLGGTGYGHDWGYAGRR